MAFDRVGEKSAIAVVVLLCCQVAQGGLVVAGPQFFSSVVRYEAGSQWVQYSWFMPGFGFDPLVVLTVDDSEGGHWEPGVSYSQWVLSEPASHGLYRDVVTSSDASAEFLHADLLGGGVLWTQYRTENVGNINTGSWETFYATQQETLADQVRTLLSQSVDEMGIVVLVVLGVFLVLYAVRRALLWCRAVAVGGLVVCAFVPQVVAQECGPYDYPRPNPNHWSDFYKPGSISVECVCDPQSSDIMLRVIAHQDDEFGGPVGSYKVNMFEMHWRHSQNDEYDGYLEGDFTFYDGVFERYAAKLADACDDGVPIRAGLYLNHFIGFPHQGFPGFECNETVHEWDAPEDFVEEFRAFILRRSYEDGDSLRWTLGCIADESNARRGAYYQDPFIDAVQAWLDEQSVFEVQGESALCVRWMTEVFQYPWVWTPQKGVQTRDTTLYEGLVSYAMGEVSLLQLFGVLEVPESVVSVPLNVSFKVPLPNDPYHTVDIVNSSFTGGFMTVTESSSVVASMRLFVRVLVACWWSAIMVTRVIVNLRRF